MSLGPFERVAVPTTESGDGPFRSTSQIVHRRRRSLPRPLVARSGKALPRTRKTFEPRKVRPYDTRLTGEHDFGDGRIALEFEGPSMDMMLYHDRGVTLAEWVTLDGRLISLIPVGDC